MVQVALEAADSADAGTVTVIVTIPPPSGGQANGVELIIAIEDCCANAVSDQCDIAAVAVSADDACGAGGECVFTPDDTNSCDDGVSCNGLGQRRDGDCANVASCPPSNPACGFE